MRPLTPPAALAGLSDEALIAMLADERVEALSVLYTRHAPSALALAQRITGDRSTAQDVVQVALISLWRWAGRYRPERGSGRGWIHALVRHGAIDAVRRKGHRERAFLAGDAPFLTLVDASDEPSVAVIRDESAQTARAALRRLPVKQREALELAYFGGYSNAEIAALIGVPLGTVKGRMRLGLARLRDIIGEPSAAAA